MRKTGEWIGSWNRLSMASVHNTFPFQLWVMSEVYEQPQLESRRVQIIQHLRPVLIHEIGNGLEFQNDLSETNKIGLVALPERTAAIRQRQRRLRHCRQLLKLKLNLHAFLIDRLQEPATFVLVHRETAAHDGVHLFLVDQILNRVSHFSVLSRV